MSGARPLAAKPPGCPRARARLVLLAVVGVSGCEGAAGPGASGGRGEDMPAASSPPSATCNDELGQHAAALSVVDRALVGSPASYVADGALREQRAELRRSQRARRERAWQIAERVLAPVQLPEGLVPAAAQATLPAWQTWHAKDDLTRIFRRLYPDLSAAEKASRARFSRAAIEAAWRWNDGAIDDFADWSMERLTAYQAAVDEDIELHGLGGIYRVAYDNAASAHWLDSYPDVLACRDTGYGEQAVAEGAAACARGEPKPACLSAAFPPGAALVKASWRRAEGAEPLPVFDTSAEALERRLTSEHAFSWKTPDAAASPSSDDIYTLRLPSGNTFRLVALHIMTKELDDWFWTTLWWSARADEDFGADRPATLPSPFRNYKLCAVAAFEEEDPDPGAGFDADHPSLARALAAIHTRSGGATWCSNPYLEEGEGNASTNCIGCHQHAGTSLTPEQILGDPQRFPNFGRTRQRATHPSDYVFEANAGDNLGAMFEETEEHFD